MVEHHSGEDASLLIGMFDPIDARAVREVARLAESGPVRALVLGDSFTPWLAPLAPGRERREIVRYVRGVTEVVLVRDEDHLRTLIERAGPAALVSWLADPAWVDLSAEFRGASHRLVLSTAV